MKRRLEVTEIACTLAADDVPTRLAEWRELLAHASGRVATPEGVRVELVGVDGASVRDLAAREQQCCAFFDLRVDEVGEVVVLHVGAPPEARPVVEELFGS